MYVTVQTAASSLHSCEVFVCDVCMCLCLCGVLCVAVPMCAHMYFLNTCIGACIQHVLYCQFFVMSGRYIYTIYIFVQFTCIMSLYEGLAINCAWFTLMDGW